MAEDREQLNNAADESSYSLESILAEYKSNAYIAGERKLSREELEKQAERILREMTGKIVLDDEPEEEVREYIPGAAGRRTPVQPEAEAVPGPEAETKPERGERNRKKEKKPDRVRAGDVVRVQKTDSDRPKEKRGDSKARRRIEAERARDAELEAMRLRRQELERRREETKASYLELDDTEQEFFGVGKYARESSVVENEEEVSAVIEREAARRSRQEARKRARGSRREAEPAAEEQEDREMTPAEAAKIYASGAAWLRRRTHIAFLFTAILAYITLAGGFGLPVPKFLTEPATFAIVSLTLLLVVVLLGVDVFVSGFGDALSGRMSGVTLASFAVVASVADAVAILVTKNASRGAPFCAVAAVSLLCAMWGTRLSKSAYKTTIKTMTTARIPTIVTAEWEKADEGIVLTKKIGSAGGFISKSLESDMSEQWYGRFAPLFVVAIILFSLISSVFRGEGGSFFHCLAAMSCAAASLSAMLAFNLPFSKIARKLAASGAALAGWSGACDIDDAVGIVIKDRDLFPENMLTLNGVKMLSNYTMERVVSYAGSMIIASGSGLTRVFGDLLKEYGSSIYRVDEFSCYEGGGIGAIINGDKVLVGSGAFMNLMGIRLPPNLDIHSAVFIAINEELAGLFIINYMPADMVQSALVTLMRSRLRPLFAIRDFNITPLMVMQKFKISMDDVEFLPFEARYKLSADSEDERIKPSAVMSREGLSHFVEVARSGKQLVSSVRMATVLSLLGACVGLLLMFFMCFKGAFASGSAANLLLFMLLWLLPILFLGFGEND